MVPIGRDLSQNLKIVKNSVEATRMRGALLEGRSDRATIHCSREWSKCLKFVKAKAARGVVVAHAACLHE